MLTVHEGGEGGPVCEGRELGAPYRAAFDVRERLGLTRRPYFSFFVGPPRAIEGLSIGVPARSRLPTAAFETRLAAVSGSLRWWPGPTIGGDQVSYFAVSIH